MEHIYNTKYILENNKYRNGKYNIFLIRESKLRLIMSQNIPDKLINHLVAKHFLVDVFDKTFIDSTVATRKDRGTHYGLKLVKKYLNNIKKDGKIFYYIKFDIKKFFYNMDHEVLKAILQRKIKDIRVLDLLNKIIDSTDEEYVNSKIDFLKNSEVSKIKAKNLTIKEKKKEIEEIKAIPHYEKGMGFPIGNMTSQIFANIYLSEFDHYIKEKLHIKYYIRYMDDGIIIHKDKDYLVDCLSKLKK